ncbi:Rpn family recombination-promoting nuclease/putative transposase [Lactobacillus kalixensis]|uniref:Rpn family recombination-promoting nuclease/putative transposase n=1 Tax=Lactobacillus kalixensis TaxID=227944 RepID=UPI00070B086A|nr:Rpn family recombination-promoting nuclease/putative transposase [Lactobacillus kalixensis]
MENDLKLSQITDDVMFENVMKDKPTCKMLIEAILPDLHISRLEVHTQRRIKDNRKNHSSILDVWVKDDQGRQYDLEMQLGKKDAMDLRARYYLSRLDTESLHTGENYEDLKAAYVIFICGFNPKGLGLKEYDFVYQCKQASSLALDTKTEIIYLNSKGIKGEVSRGIQDLFKMMNNQVPEQTQFTDQIKKRMIAYSETPEWRDHVMYVDALVDEAAKKSIQKIIKQFRSEGRDDQSTLDFLINIYGDQYSEADLKKFIEEAK